MRPTAANPLKVNRANARAVETLIKASKDDTDDVSAFAVIDPNGERFQGVAFVVRNALLGRGIQIWLEQRGHMTPNKSVTKNGGETP